MTILYSLIARGKAVLAEYFSVGGNFPTVTRVLLNKIPQADMRQSYQYDAHIFHIIVSDGITYLCMSDDEPGKRRVPFMFLEDIKNTFIATYGNRVKTAMAFSLNEDFSRVLDRQMEHFNSGQVDKLDQVKAKIDQAKSEVHQVVDKLFERDERIDLLVDRAEKLNQQAFDFDEQSNRLKRAMWWKNLKLKLLIWGLVILVIYILLAWGCGGILLPDCL